MLGDRRGAVAGDVGDDEPALLGGGEIDRVPARGEDADVFQAGGVGDGVRVEHGLVEHDRIRIPNSGKDIGRGGPIMDRAVGPSFDGRPGKIPGIRGESIQNDETRAFHALDSKRWPLGIQVRDRAGEKGTG